jgi:hypothetical protein
MKVDCKFYPMCDHRNFLVGVVCDRCPWRESRMADAKLELEKAKRQVAMLTAMTAGDHR